MPGLRQRPGTKKPVTFDEIVDALRSLDDDPPPRPGGKAMRLRPPWRRRERHGSSGTPMH